MLPFVSRIVSQFYLLPTLLDLVYRAMLFLATFPVQLTQGA